MNRTFVIITIALVIAQALLCGGIVAQSILTAYTCSYLDSMGIVVCPLL